MHASYCSNVPPANPLYTRAAVRPRARVWSSLVIAVALFTLAYENGGYGIRERSIAGIALWWIVVLAVALGLVPRQPLSPATRGVAMLLGAFALWTLLSTIWAPSPELAFAEFDRCSLYLALFLVVAGAGGLRGLDRWLDGLRLAVGAIAVVALISRLFPHVFHQRAVAAFLPNAATRLSFPIGYWNALAVFVALAMPPLLAAACSARTALRRGLALAVVPILVADIVLASSRGGVLALVVGAVVFVAAADRRWSALAVGAIAAFGSALAVVVLRAERTLLDGPLGGAAAQHEGRVAAALLLGIAGLTAALLVLGERAWSGRRAPQRRVGVVLVAALAVVILVAGIVAHPVRRFDAFRQVPTAGQTGPDFARAHLTSGSGSGRWQFWSAAVHEWESAPVLGRGAGSYRFWWSEHASFTYTLLNAHSLYLEVLGELGLVGLLLLVGALAWGLAAGVQVVRGTAGTERTQLAALCAALAAFVVCAGIDWLWQVTAVAAVGIVALALVASCADSLEARPVRALPGWPRLAFGAGALLAAWVAILAALVPWLTAARISDSQGAARRGDLAGARADAQDAHTIQPWAASPEVQLALVDEAAGDLESALHWIHSAAAHDTDNWSTWYVASRIEREAGHAGIAAADWRRAKSLDVRSPIFARQGVP